MRIISDRAHNLQLRASVTSLHQTRPMSSMGTAQGYINRMYPHKLYGRYANGGVRAGFENKGYDARVDGRAWFAVDNEFKNKSRGNGLLGHGNENMDRLK